VRASQLSGSNRPRFITSCVERQKPYNWSGSRVRLTLRSGLAPQPVRGGYGAVSCYTPGHGGLYTAGLLFRTSGRGFLFGHYPDQPRPVCRLLGKLIQACRCSRLRRFLSRLPIHRTARRTAPIQAVSFDSLGYFSSDTLLLHLCL
jgi:hypothetical protein